MTGCRHPVSGSGALDSIANLRRGNVGQRFTDGQTGGRQSQQRHRRRARQIDIASRSSCQERR